MMMMQMMTLRSDELGGQLLVIAVINLAPRDNCMAPPAIRGELQTVLVLTYDAITINRDSRAGEDDAF